MRRFFLTLLFLALIIPLNRDETWALPNLSDQHLTEAGLDDIIGRYLSAAQDPYMSCNCDAPKVECNDICAPRQEEGGWICGTPANQTDLAIRKAIEAGAHPMAIGRLIAELPYPFSKMYSVMNHPDAKPLESLLPEPGL